MTHAMDATNNTDQSLAEEKTHLIDTHYANLVPGEEYTVSGYLHARDKETGEDLGVLMLDGTIGDASVATPVTAVHAEKTFTADAADGEVLLEFVYDATSLGGDPVVAFERLVQNEVVVAVHADITDENQTVHIPFIRTVARTNDGSQTASVEGDVIHDTVAYAGLVPGRSYTMTGHMVDTDGTPITSDVSVTFTPTSQSGEVTVDMPIDTSKHYGEHIVAFERLSDENNNVIGRHEDINDAD